MAQPPGHRRCAAPGGGDVRAALRAAGVAVACALAVTLPHGMGAPVISRTADSQPTASHERRHEHATPGQTGHTEQDSEAAPTRIRIPAIGVTAPLEPLTVGPDRVLPPPKNPGTTGWWQDGPEPGEPGPAVLVGHFDSDTGPAVFYRLAELRHGDRVAINRSDGTTVFFTVRRLASYPQDAFPTDQVYGDTGNRPALRLITCGGSFDHAADRYTENLIVSATKT
jgi:sortase (surface protein transpeptidase)